MTKKKNIYISMGEASLLLGIHKSRLAWYHKLGLIKKQFVSGKMYLFDRNVLLKTIKRIDRLQVRGLKLNEIKDKLYEDRNRISGKI